MYLKLINRVTGKKVGTFWFKEIPLPSSTIRVQKFNGDVDVYGMQFYETKIISFFGLFSIKLRYVGVLWLTHNDEQVKETTNKKVFRDNIKVE